MALCVYMRRLASGWVVGLLTFLVCASANATGGGGVLGFSGGGNVQLETTEQHFAPGFLGAAFFGYRHASGVEAHLRGNFTQFETNDKSFRRTIGDGGLGLRYWFFNDDRDVFSPYIGAYGGGGSMTTSLTDSQTTPATGDPSGTLGCAHLMLDGGIALNAGPNASFGLFVAGNAYVPFGTDAADSHIVFSALIGLDVTFSGLDGLSFLNGVGAVFEGLLRIR